MAQLRSLLAWLMVFSGLTIAAGATESASAGPGTSPCCPADLTGSGTVDGNDLAILLGSWGPCAGCVADFDGSGFINGTDLAVILGAWGQCPFCPSTTVTGSVIQLDGSLVSDAVIVTDRGGKGVSTADGSFEFEVFIVDGATTLHATAVAQIAGTTYMGTSGAVPITIGGTTNIGPITVQAETPTCDDLAWLPTFGAHPPGVEQSVYALTVFDDGSGSGPALYAGGLFTEAGGLLVNRVVRWNGSSWSALGEGVGSGVDSVFALAVFDDGSGGGPALYAGGDFTSAGGVAANRIARWNGSSWSPLGSGMNGTVHALTVFDDGSGSGPALYAGGTFFNAGGVAASRVARWNGSSWSPLSFGVNNTVFALTVFDDGSGGGPALYAGGVFLTAGGAPASRVARWNGSSWSSLGSGVNDRVYALTVFDDGSGSGPALFAGGEFTAAGGASANRIARWNGSIWSPLGSGMNNFVYALTVLDDGSGTGPALYAGGDFTTAGGASANRVARWSGANWSALASGVNGSVRALTLLDDGSGGDPVLFAGGLFSAAGGIPVDHLARWSSASWASLSINEFNNSVYSLTVHDDGSGGGPALYAGGLFTTAAGATVNSIARWNGLSWTPLGSGMNGNVLALLVYDDGSGAGPALYAGGAFTTAGGVAADRIARWNGSSWSPLGSGMNNTVRALAIFDDGSGSGPALYAGGAFTNAGGVAANRVARWNGSSWSPLGTGTNNTVHALAVYDAGSGDGPQLYAGGSFTNAGGVALNRIARWNGSSWSSVGSGMSNEVLVMTVFDDGSGGGPALFAGGSFTSAGGSAANRIARWNGSSWSSLGSGVNFGVYALTVFDDGSGGGPALYAGGDFTQAGVISVGHVARWNGSSWSALGGWATDSDVYALTVFDDGFGGGPALFAGGVFLHSTSGDSYLIKWGCPAPE